MGTLEQAGITRLGAVKPKTTPIAAEVWTQCKLAGASCYTMHGYRWEGTSGGEHGTGYAIDFMVGYPGHHDDGQAIRDYIWQHRARFGLRHVIWEQHITSTVRLPGQVRLMEDRDTPTQNHMDHVHALWNLEPTTYMPKPPVYPVRTLSKGFVGSDVKALQRGLNAVFDFEGAFLVVDGIFGSATQIDVMAFQQLKGLAVDGKVGPITRKALAYTGISL